MSQVKYEADLQVDVEDQVAVEVPVATGLDLRGFEVEPPQAPEAGERSLDREQPQFGLD